MTHLELYYARTSMGLTRAEMAAMLDTDPTTVKRWEMDPENKSARPAPARVERLVRAYLDGWRPCDWPRPQREEIAA